MDTLKFRNLKKNEIQCRVRQITEDRATNGTYCSLLLYKDARVDQNILDETVGPERWQKEYHEKCGQLFCTISIKMDNGEWVSKEDTGSKDANFEAEKSLASDAQKRAGFLWGIGRALYTKIDIDFFLGRDEYYFNTRANTNVLSRGVRFFVSDIEYDKSGNTITKLQIQDQLGRVRFNYPFKA